LDAGAQDGGTHLRTVVGSGRVLGESTKALRWAPDAGAAAQVLSGDRATVAGYGDAIGVGGNNQTVVRWPLAGGTYQMAAPWQSQPDDISDNGSLSAKGLSTRNLDRYLLDVCRLARF
jgi:hypothetical protein